MRMLDLNVAWHFLLLSWGEIQTQGLISNAASEHAALKKPRTNPLVLHASNRAPTASHETTSELQVTGAKALRELQERR